jgi:hypothetical protein
MGRLAGGVLLLAVVLTLSGCPSTPGPASSQSSAPVTTTPTSASSLLPPLAVIAPGEPDDVPSGLPACGGGEPYRLSVSSDVAQLVSACGGVTQGGSYSAWFVNLKDAVLDVYPSVPLTYQQIYSPKVDLGLIPFTWDDAEVYVQTVAEEKLHGPVGAYLVPVGGSILLVANTPVHIQVQIDPNATAESRAGRLLVDYVVDNLKEEVPENSVIDYTMTISECVNAAFNLWIALNQEESEAAPNTISTALTTRQQCQDLQEKLQEDPHSELHVAEVHPISTDDLSQDLSKVADDAKQDDWPSIVDHLIHDAGKIAEDLHP